MEGLYLFLLIITYVCIFARVIYRLCMWLRRRSVYREMCLEEKLEAIAYTLPDDEMTVLLDAADFIGRIRDWQYRREHRHHG